MTRVSFCIVPHSITEDIIFIAKLVVNQCFLIPCRMLWLEMLPQGVSYPLV